MSSEFRSEGSCMKLLKTLGRDEILEVLSQGLCERCDAALLARIESIAKGNQPLKFVLLNATFHLDIYS